MRNKSYIAVLLVSVFLVKFIAIDADVLSVLFSNSDITFVNTHCKKRNSNELSKDTADVSQGDDSSLELLNMAGYCSSVFNFNFFSWKSNQSKPTAVFNEHFLTSLNYLYLDKVSPPPRLA